MKRRRTVAEAQAQGLTVYPGRAPHVRHGAEAISGAETLESVRETYWADRYAEAARAAGLVAECLVSHNEATFMDECDMCHDAWPADEPELMRHEPGCVLGQLLAFLQEPLAATSPAPQEPTG